VARVYDTFMFTGTPVELDMLQCRLVELEWAPIYRHVIVEADITHRGELKPLVFPEHRDRFARWADRITYIPVSASDLPSVADAPDPWEREHAQREHTREGLTDADLDDVVLHGDVDEIPATGAVWRVANDPSPPLVFEQAHYMYAADWQYPGLVWPGTIAARVRDVAGFQWLRAQRWDLPRITNAGWHLSWMGGLDEQRRKLGLHCHSEMTPAEHDRIGSGAAYRDGAHHGGAQMIPVEVDGTWPWWIAQRKCPPSWFRPR